MIAQNKLAQINKQINEIRSKIKAFQDKNGVSPKKKPKTPTRRIEKMDDMIYKTRNHLDTFGLHHSQLDLVVAECLYNPLNYSPSKSYPKSSEKIITRVRELRNQAHSSEDLPFDVEAAKQEFLVQVLKRKANKQGSLVSLSDQSLTEHHRSTQSSKLPTISNKTIDMNKKSSNTRIVSSSLPKAPTIKNIPTKKPAAVKSTSSMKVNKQKSEELNDFAFLFDSSEQHLYEKVKNRVPSSARLDTNVANNSKPTTSSGSRNGLVSGSSSTRRLSSGDDSTSYGRPPISRGLSFSLREETNVIRPETNYASKRRDFNSTSGDNGDQNIQQRCKRPSVTKLPETAMQDFRKEVRPPSKQEGGGGDNESSNDYNYDFDDDMSSSATTADAEAMQRIPVVINQDPYSDDGFDDDSPPVVIDATAPIVPTVQQQSKLSTMPNTTPKTTPSPAILEQNHQEQQVTRKSSNAVEVHQNISAVSSLDNREVDSVVDGKFIEENSSIAYDDDADFDADKPIISTTPVIASKESLSVESIVSSRKSSLTSLKHEKGEEMMSSSRAEESSLYKGDVAYADIVEVYRTSSMHKARSSSVDHHEKEEGHESSSVVDGKFIDENDGGSSVAYDDDADFDVEEEPTPSSTPAVIESKESTADSRKNTVVTSDKLLDSLRAEVIEPPTHGVVSHHATAEYATQPTQSTVDIAMPTETDEVNCQQQQQHTEDIHISKIPSASLHSSARSSVVYELDAIVGEDIVADQDPARVLIDSRAAYTVDSTTNSRQGSLASMQHENSMRHEDDETVKLIDHKESSLDKGDNGNNPAEVPRTSSIQVAQSSSVDHNEKEEDHASSSVVNGKFVNENNSIAYDDDADFDIEEPTHTAVVIESNTTAAGSKKKSIVASILSYSKRQEQDEKAHVLEKPIISEVGSRKGSASLDSVRSAEREEVKAGQFSAVAPLVSTVSSSLAESKGSPYHSSSAIMHVSSSSEQVDTKATESLQQQQQQQYRSYSHVSSDAAEEELESREPVYSATMVMTDPSLGIENSAVVSLHSQDSIKQQHEDNKVETSSSQYEGSLHDAVEVPRSSIDVAQSLSLDHHESSSVVDGKFVDEKDGGSSVAYDDDVDFDVEEEPNPPTPAVIESNVTAVGSKKNSVVASLISSSRSQEQDDSAPAVNDDSYVQESKDTILIRPSLSQDSIDDTPGQLSQPQEEQQQSVHVSISSSSLVTGVEEASSSVVDGKFVDENSSVIYDDDADFDVDNATAGHLFEGVDREEPLVVPAATVASRDESIVMSSQPNNNQVNDAIVMSGRRPSKSQLSLGSAHESDIFDGDEKSIGKYLNSNRDSLVEDSLYLDEEVFDDDLRVPTTANVNIMPAIISKLNSTATVLTEANTGIDSASSDDHERNVQKLPKKQASFSDVPISNSNTNDEGDDKDLESILKTPEEKKKSNPLLGQQTNLLLSAVSEVNNHDLEYYMVSRVDHTASIVEDNDSIGSGDEHGFNTTLEKFIQKQKSEIIERKNTIERQKSDVSSSITASAYLNSVGSSGGIVQQKSDSLSGNNSRRGSRRTSK